MAKEARELEAFLNSIAGKEELAAAAGNLAEALEAANILKITKPTPKIELPRGIRREHLKPDKPLSKEAFAVNFAANKIDARYAQPLIDVITLTGEAPDLELAWLSGRDLGLIRAVPYMRFLEVGEERGYHTLHPEVGLYLRLFDINQPKGIYWPAMEPVNVGRHPSVFVLERSGSGLWLDADWSNPDGVWGSESRLVFSFSK